MNIEKLHSLYLNCSNACTDTRQIQKNNMFFALKGPNFNGNKYAEEAIKKGALYAVVDEEKYLKNNDRIILVDNVQKALQQLATYHRNFLGLKILSLTGSNGKTTTKELINAVLSKKYNTVATKGNLNNHIGVPLTLLSMNKNTEFGIVEMGANHLKEIETLCSITHPDYGYITNFGKAHLEGFGSVEGVIKGKTELYDYLINNDKTVFCNANDSIQIQKLKDYKKKFCFGSDISVDVKIIQKKSNNANVTVWVEDVIIESQLIGNYNFTNIASAICIGKHFNIPLNKIKEAIEGYVPTNNRSQLIIKDNKKIVMDAYNANPSSMKAALDNFASLPDANKIIFLGDMFELGETSFEEHQFISEYASHQRFNEIFLIGENFYKTENSKAKKFKTFTDFETFIKSYNVREGIILIKGSRGMALERILPLI
ncbi:UDP-N-acetylmuramoyl-tripeptide--D-alanyl-D-alanine ligase [Abyssalbus ytuae]|uniref:UDP-N-acetylmuramoyl-tripeptide--D-alanyl-D-alanine ligase n=1 Tax=Abyssalbus ytuae TaxID=2926907 RepID=A0A9E6ZTE5_9FLAO|nr:UDP-N-acetylmuramoyl-tripeptide--D-alanyl-D-alanine ligase [Abyssalbus ytuae]UOB18528.1 UDP-N-acetylmuramoyl-tripeptide--D-alanyl-D-alanine ligase [Abyssalbus ytuae]